MAATGIQTIHPEAEDQAVFDVIAALLDRQGPILLETANRRIEIPEALLAVIQQAVEILRTGGAVSIVPHDIALTTQQAADYLGVSRPFLISLLEKEGIHYTYAGTHRRIPLSEIQKYRIRRDAERMATLDVMTREAYELGLYDVDRSDAAAVRGGS